METASALKPRERSHLPFLDALRGTMAVWVLAGHTLIAAGGTIPYLSTPSVAVDVFMMVSGFLMAYYFRVREQKEPWEAPSTWTAFYIRRFFRIAPAYYVLLTLGYLFRDQLQGCAYEVLRAFPHAAEGAAVSRVLPPLGVGDILAHLTFTFGFIPRFASNTPLPDWSIGLEMQFYLALPFIMLLYRRAGHVLSTFLLLGVWVAAKHLIGVSFEPAKVLGHFPMPTFLPLKLSYFVVGILLAESLHIRARDGRKSLLLCLFALGIAVVCGPKVFTFVSCLTALLLIFPAESAPGFIRSAFDWVGRGLDSRFCGFLAETSYGVYLVHGLLLWPIGSWLGSHPAYLRLPANERYLIFLSLMLCAAYPIAILVHKFIEQPGIQLGKRFVHRPAHGEKARAPRAIPSREPAPVKATAEVAL